MDRITLTGFCPISTPISTNVLSMNLRAAAALIGTSLATFAAGSSR